MYHPENYAMRQVGMPFVYKPPRSKSKTGKKMFQLYQSTTIQTVEKELPTVPDRWVSEIKDNFIYYTTAKKSPSQRFRHNYDYFDPYRSSSYEQFEPQGHPRQYRQPLEQVVPPKMGQGRPMTAPVLFEEKRSRKPSGRTKQRIKRKYVDDESDLEERNIQRRKRSLKDQSDEEYPPEREKKFTKAEETKFHTQKTLAERAEEKEKKALSRLERTAFHGVTNVKPKFTLPKGTQPEFCNYGWANTNPIREEDYLKTFNVKARRLSQLHDYVTTRRDRTHGYREWRKYMKCTPKNFEAHEEMKRKKLTRPKTPPRMHAAKKKGYQGVSHYFKGEEQQQQQQQQFQPQIEKKRRKKVSKKKKGQRKKNKKEEEDEYRESSQIYNPKQTQKQPQQQQPRKVKKGGFRKYMEEEPLEEVIEHAGTDSETEEDYHYHQQRGTEVRSSVFSFEPKEHNNEDWNPRNYKHLPHEYTCYIRSAGVRTIRDQGESVSQVLNQFS